jgi:homoserine dehydrogenase
MSVEGGAPTAPFRVGLLGHGTVGGAFAELLAERAAEIERFNGRAPVISGVLTRSRGSFDDVLADAEIVVELMGGLEPAREYLLTAMRAGRDVVSANKQLLSQHGEELFEVARERGVRLRFEAAVAGAVPVVRLLEESLAATPIERIHGIVNGTTNFILSEMARGSDYAQALAEAQRLGYAEADPSDDVSGRDAAAKMAILARLAFGVPVSLEDVSYEGIEHLQSDDLEYARELGLGLKLIGTAERRAEGLSVRVHPAFLYAGHPLSSVSGPFNAITVESEAVTEITLSGPGAGGRQTASAVLGDVVSVMTGGARPPAPPLAFPLLGDIESAFYLHVEVADMPGVLAGVTRVLDEQGVSIKSFVQRGRRAAPGVAPAGGAPPGPVSRGPASPGVAPPGESSAAGREREDVRLVMVAHPLSEARLREALQRLADLEFVRSAPRAIRVIEEEFG